ncbi:MAG TPA: heparinase, partial [Alphaproteobacteria bacterium]|nr:heparinase [Alphaproteobacteria bacterium]
MSLLQKIQNKIRHHAGHLTYNSPLYNWSLGGTVPDKLLFSPCDLWQGDADNARWLVHSGAFTIGGDRLELHNADWTPEDAGDHWIEHINSFDWLRDLRALGGQEGRIAARYMVENWIDNFQSWDAQTWRSDILGRRLGNWLASYDFFGESADSRFQEIFLDSVVRQLRHLGRALPGLLNGLPLLYAIKGLAYGGLTLEGREN